MKRFVRILIILTLVFAMLAELAACSFLSQEELAQLKDGDTASSSSDGKGGETPPVEEIVVPDDLRVVISEVMPSNKASYAVDGAFPDWVELLNEGDESVSLRGLVLCCGTESYDLPERSLAAGEYLVIACDGSEAELHAPFSIPKEGAVLTLRSIYNKVFDEMTVPACDSDESFVRDSGGAVILSDLPTPGYPNSGAGYEAMQEALVCSSPLQISEVIVYNKWYPSPDGSCYDWVELKNVSDAPLTLSDYYLSDSAKDRLSFRLPELTLGSGEYVVIFCTGSSATAPGDIYAPFALGSTGDHLYLSAADGTLLDYVATGHIPLYGSFGRMEGENGFFYLSEATPYAANAAGVRRMAAKPVLVGQEGVFDGVDSVTAELRAAGEIHYTTDGSEPTAESPVYVEPLVFDSTAVLRAISLEEGCLPSEVLNLSFIINENHTLPVVSLMMEPRELTDRRGMYINFENELEVPGAVEFFDGEESFSLACGVKLHGATSKRISQKKSLKLCFRGQYEGDLHYDLFGNGVTEYGSILLRHPVEETISSMLRDVLIHKLANECFPALPAQDYRPAVLYINGAYWGLYDIREAHSAEHFAQHYGYEQSDVLSWKRLWDRNTAGGQACQFALYNNLSTDEKYQQVASHIDLDSLIGWCILQAWCANFDCNPSNVRYYYSKSDETVHYALSDLDLGMFNIDAFEIPFLGSFNAGVRNNYDFNKVPRSLMANHDFQLRMAQALSDALHGGLSDESVLAMIDRYEQEIEPEMEREVRRWFPMSSVDTWHRKVQVLRNFVTQNGGRAKTMIASFKSFSRLSAEEYEQYFGDLG